MKRSSARGSPQQTFMTTMKKIQRNEASFTKEPKPCCKWSNEAARLLLAPMIGFYRAMSLQIPRSACRTTASPVSLSALARPFVPLSVPCQRGTDK